MPSPFRIVQQCVFFLLTLCTTSAPAWSVFQNKNQLSKINHSIEDIKAQLSAEQKLREQYEKDLKNAETSVSALHNQLSKTQEKLKQQKNYLTTLKKQEEKIQQTIAEHEAVLAQQVHDVYMLQNPSFLQLLLGQDDAKIIDRMRMYYHYLALSKAKVISNLHRDIEKLQLTRLKTTRQSMILQTLQTQQETNREQLEQFKSYREQVVQKINTRILSKNQLLQQLVENKRRLENTIAALQKSEASTFVANLKQTRGKLPWPVMGKIVNEFGTKIYQSELRWNGVVIQAQANQPVHSIADGKVIFSDWLPGYGLLLIINHGKGLMSLYGRNHTLNKKVGDIVHQGEVIASVGQSGGYDTPSLYFAIRENAKPVDPLKWCSRLN